MKFKLLLTISLLTGLNLSAMQQVTAPQAQGAAASTAAEEVMHKLAELENNPVFMLHKARTEREEVSLLAGASDILAEHAVLKKALAVLYKPAVQQYVASQIGSQQIAGIIKEYLF